MNVSFSKNFLKQAKKLDPLSRQRIQERIFLFTENPLNPKLRNHQFRGAYKEYRSIDITSDIRALYLQLENEVVFDAVGTHSQLYGSQD